MAKTRLHTLDALRGIAAMVVIFPHSTGLFYALPQDSLPRMASDFFTPFGLHAIDVFFVISGFVIAMTASQDLFTVKGALNFNLRRLVRLAPPYWLSLVLMLVVLYARHYFGQQQVDLPSAGSLLAHVFYLQAWLGYDQINVVCWTLCMEVQFYLFFSVALVIINQITSSITGRRKIASWCLAASFLVSLVLFLQSPVYPPHQRSFIYQWYEFGFGIWAWFVVSSPRKERNYLPVACGLIALGTGVVTANVYILTAFATFALISVLGRCQQLGRPARQPFQFLGRISYSIYLVHVPVIALCLPIRVRFVPNTPASIGWFFCGVVVAITGAAWLFYLAVEKPAISWSRKFSSRK